MDEFRIQGPTKLQGEVAISDVKNVALPTLFAALLVEEPVEIQNIPKLKDVDTSIELLSQLGAKVERDGSVHVNARDVSVFYTPYDLVKTMRASIWALGPLVARFGQGQVPLPSGCTTGAHLVDLHISGLEQLGATIKPERGCTKASVDGRLESAHIMMDKVNVGATAIIACAATLAEGTMIIEDATHESEIVNTASFSITLGTKISGQGIDRIVIEDVERLGGGVYRALSDHVETGTSLVAAAISRGKTICRNAQLDTLDVVLAKLRGARASVEVSEDWTGLDTHDKRPRAVNVRTASHLAFPTDMQAQFALLNLMAEGTGFITETVFENHFMHMPELNRMGAHAKIESNTVICHGVERLSDTQAMVTDLRASASLVLAGCTTKETTVVDRIYHIDRGYEHIEDELRALGTNIEHMKGE